MQQEDGMNNGEQGEHVRDVTDDNGESDVAKKITGAERSYS